MRGDFDILPAEVYSLVEIHVAATLSMLPFILRDFDFLAEYDDKVPVVGTKIGQLHDL